MYCISVSKVLLCTKMEYILVFILIISVFGNTLLVYGQNVTEGDRYFTYLDENNSTITIDLQEEPDMQLLQLAFDQDNNKYLLYTKNNTVPQRLSTGNITSINSSDFNSNLITVFVVHGWRGDNDNKLYKVLRTAFSKYDVNFIAVDWSYISYASYKTAATAVVKVGKALGAFMAYLVEVTGMSYSKVHLVGYSLGAHVCGNAGRYVGGAVARITGCDAAGLSFKGNPARVQARDGVYVEGIHTSSLGISLAYGHTDFYPNGGQDQPGCNVLNLVCKHMRSYQLFASTVEYNSLDGQQCKTNYEFDHDKCSGENLKMGNNDLNKTGNGRFRLNTTSTYPFC